MSTRRASTPVQPSPVKFLAGWNSRSRQPEIKHSLVIGPVSNKISSKKSTDGERCEVVGFYPKLERQTGELRTLQDGLRDSLAIAPATLSRGHA
jgi:hypothetical protein